MVAELLDGRMRGDHVGEQRDREQQHHDAEPEHGAAVLGERDGKQPQRAGRGRGDGDHSGLGPGARHQRRIRGLRKP